MPFSSATKPEENPVVSVLYVDDNADDEVLFEKAWRKAGLPHSWRVARTLSEARAYLKHLVEQGKCDARWPCLIVVDATLPDGDGLEIVKFVRRIPEIKHVPVVLVSGIISPHDRTRAKADGADLCVEKPCGITELVEVVMDFYLLAVRIAKTST